MLSLFPTSVKYFLAAMALFGSVWMLVNRSSSDHLEPGPEVHDTGVITRIYGFEPSTQRRVKMNSSGLHTLKIRSDETKGGIAYEIDAKQHKGTLVYKVDSAKALDLSVGDEVELMHMEFPVSQWSREIMVLYVIPKEEPQEAE